MKKLIVVLYILFITVISCSAQSKELKQKVAEYASNKMYIIDGDNIVVSSVLENIEGDKNDIYIKTKNFLSRYYIDSKSAIQTDDKEAGIIIVNGIYANLRTWVDFMAGQNTLSANHIIRIDIKDGRVRVLCSVNNWSCHYVPSRGIPSDVMAGILLYAPITDKRLVDKGKQTEAFINLIDKMHESIDSLEKSLREGVLKDENKDW